VQIDEARRHDEAARVELAPRRLRLVEEPHGDDLPAVDAQVGPATWPSLPVDDVPTADHEVERSLAPEGWLDLRRRGLRGGHLVADLRSGRRWRVGLRTARRREGEQQERASRARRREGGRHGHGGATLPRGGRRRYGVPAKRRAR
jgi:hypothetical protein